MDGMIRDGWIETRPGDDDPGAIALMHKLSAEVAQALARVRDRRAAPAARAGARPPVAAVGDDRPPPHPRSRSSARRVPPIGSDFVSLEAASGHRAAARRGRPRSCGPTPTPPGYASWWHRELTIGPGDLAITESLVHWVNDALDDHLLLRRRARDQARAGHRRAARPQPCRAARRSPRSAAWSCPRCSTSPINVGWQRPRRLGDPHGHRHRVRGRRARAARRRACRAA